nr:glutamate--tRNA ligase family protein [Rhodothermus marinus]
MAHLPLILSPKGGKLSKRNAEELGIPVLVRQYRELGYEPEALVNYLAFLGWNPGTEQEVFTLEELIEAFSLDRVRPAPCSSASTSCSGITSSSSGACRSRSWPARPCPT